MTSQPDRLWEAVKLSFFGTREEFFESLEGWDVAEDSGSFMLYRGPEMHWVPGGKLTRQMIRKYLSMLIDRHGYATTRTPIDDTRQQKFNERIGFVRTGADDEYIHYRIEDLHL